MSVFSIDLAGLPAGASRVLLEADPEALGLPVPGWTGRIRGAFDVDKSGDRIAVRGQIEGMVELDCVRCLKTYALPLQVPMVVFAERIGTGSRIEEEELERDDYMLFHDGRHLDLKDEAREALLLEIPMAPHCREGCAGLCPRCGSDLNEGPCSCALSSSERSA